MKIVEFICKWLILPAIPFAGIPYAFILSIEDYGSKGELEYPLSFVTYVLLVQGSWIALVSIC